MTRNRDGVINVATYIKGDLIARPPWWRLARRLKCYHARQVMDEVIADRMGVYDGLVAQGAIPWYGEARGQ
jgi:hypothetical protein